MSPTSTATYDVAIVGGGVTGAAVLFTLARYTNLSSLILVENYGQLGAVNSYANANSQTLHFGDIESNYDITSSQRVKEGANLIAGYLMNFEPRNRVLWRRHHKMALAVGAREAQQLEEHYGNIKELYPDLAMIDREEIAEIEPEVVRGRPENEELRALLTHDGFIVDYGQLAQSFVNRAYETYGTIINVFLNSPATTIEHDTEDPDGPRYVLTTTTHYINARTVIVAAGASSLMFAKRLGYGKQYMLMPTAGNFYCSTRRLLNGKIYTIQEPKMPFAEVHGDPDLHNPDQTRFGPTVLVLPMLERGVWGSIGGFLRSIAYDWNALRTFFAIAADRDYIRFAFKNILYQVPFLGHWLYVRTARKIVPTLESDDLVRRKRFGGIRPQLLDKEKHEIVFGEGEIDGDNIIFNITPSPGASASLGNAREIARKVTGFFNSGIQFDEKRFFRDLERPDR